MNILYLDTLFFVNFICDYIMLLCTARCCGTRIDRFYIISASLMGGAYACIAVLPRFLWLGHWICKCAAGLGMCLLAFWREQKVWRCVLCFLCLSALFGGVFTALSFSANGMLYLPLNGKIFLPVFAVIYCILSLCFSHFTETIQPDTRKIDLTFHGNTISFCALHDTGNRLYDPVSNLPVLICSPETLMQLFPELTKADLTADPYTLFFTLSSLTNYAGKMKLIPYQTIDRKGVLAGFSPDEAFIDGVPTEIVVAINRSNFTTQNKFEAIL